MFAQTLTSHGFSATEIKATYAGAFHSDAIFAVLQIDFLALFHKFMQQQLRSALKCVLLYLLYGCVSQGLGTTKSTNLIG